MPDAPSPSWPRSPGLPPLAAGTVVTVGTFDGVHRGHWQVLQALRRKAELLDRRSVLVTFHPHPLRIVRPQDAPSLLTTPVEKKEILAESGLDYAVFLSFTPMLAAYPPRRFVEEILIGRLRMDHLVIGYDHGFGRDRSGGAETLRSIGTELGFSVDVVPAVEKLGEAVSSTRIRQAVAEGDLGLAMAGLGRPYSLRGPVVRGDGRGRALGFPTANIQVVDAEKLLPREGVYAVRAALRDGLYDGVLHLGPRPSFRGSPPAIELHIFDFSRDIYGEEVRIDFHRRIRDIHRFAHVPDLVEAIRGDCAVAREILAGSPAGESAADPPRRASG